MSLLVSVLFGLVSTAGCLDVGKFDDRLVIVWAAVLFVACVRPLVGFDETVFAGPAFVTSGVFVIGFVVVVVEGFVVGAMVVVVLGFVVGAMVVEAVFGGAIVVVVEAVVIVVESVVVGAIVVVEAVVVKAFVVVVSRVVGEVKACVSPAITLNIHHITV